jgi:ElaB/YqjD/DUF883 family membrane-anchored ribosome-binding protein
MSDLTAAQKDKLMSDLKLVIGDAEQLLRMSASDASEGVADLRSRLLERMNEATADLAQLQDIALEKARELGDAADAYVHKNPWQSVGIAAGIGLVVGLLMSRR